MLIVYLFIYFILSISLPPELFLFNIRPDLLLIAVLFIGLFNLKNGALLVFALGLLKDVLSSGPLGLNAVCFSLWFLLARQVSRQMYKDNKPLFILLTLFATAGNYIIYYVMAVFFVHRSVPVAGFLFLIILIELAYNSFFAYLLFNIFNKCASRYSLS